MDDPIIKRSDLPKRPRHHLQQTIRMYLRSKSYTDGLTVDALVLLINTHRSSINESLNKMPDAYIDRWVKPRQGPRRYTAVWCVVVPPENCPPPSRQ